MKTNTKTITTLALLAVMSGVTGCAAQDSAPADETSDLALTAPCGKPEGEPTAPASAGYLENIARLKALRIFEVEPLSDLIGETSNCYVSKTVIGVVCVQDVAKHAEEIAAAEKKLADFTVLAEKVAASATPGADLSASSSFEALKNLHIFEVGAFIVDEPESYSCYGFCNPSNQKRAAQLNEIISAL